MKLKSCHRWAKWTARGIAAATLFMGCTTFALAADEVNAAASRATGPAPTRAAPSTSAVQTSANSAPAASDSAPKVICLQNSIRCFPVKPAPGTSAHAALDLRAPDIRRVFPAAELAVPLQDPDEAVAVQETVQVEGQREQTPVSVGIMALPWAVLHPTQAWRIFMPLPGAK
jgi:hypothetical protein